MLAASSRAPRALAEPRRFRLLRSLTALTVSIATGIVVAVWTSGVTLALWKDTAPIPAGVVTSATLALTATESFDDSLWSNLLVGEKKRQTFTVTNTGNIPINLSATATAAPGFEVRLARSVCTADLAGIAATKQPRALATLAAGATATVCTEVAVVAGALPNVSTPIAVVVMGSQQ